jgi:dienelactone hydrolase
MKTNKTLLVLLFTTAALFAGISRVHAQAGVGTTNASSPIPMSVGAASAGTMIHFSSLDTSRPFQVSGTLYLPENTSGPCPAIVLVHGATGIDARGVRYREPILNAGIAIFEVDFKTGVFTSYLKLPLNGSFVPMAFAALKELRKLPAIDPNRIGIMGFSLGGGATLRTAMENNRKAWMGDEKGFATHVAFYPVCKYFITQLENSGSELTGAPMIVFYGTEDCYGDGKAVPVLKSLLAEKYHFELTTVEYPGAAHAFDLDAPARSFPDPTATDGNGYMAWDADAANDALPRVVAFLRKTLAVK